MSKRSRTLKRLLATLLLTVSAGCATTSSQPTATVRGQGDEGIAAGANAGKDFLNRITGRGAMANVPVANKLPWFGGAKSKNEREAEAHFFRGDDATRQGIDARERKAFRQAVNAFSLARKAYREAAKAFPDSPLEEDSLFMIAECQFFSDEYADAFESYEKLIAKFKGTRHLDTVVARQFAMGRYWLNDELKNSTWRLLPNWSDEKRPIMDTQGAALRALEKTRLNLPTGSLADDSIMLTSGWYFSNRQFRDADYYYTLIRREYPNSEHQFDAHVLGIQSKIRSYQGSNYDGTVMIEAKELIEQTLKQFTEIRPEDRQRLMNLHAQVNRALAQRDFSLAEYYAAKGYNGAARVYYERVASKFPRTELAARARDRDTATQTKPTEPPRRLTWVSALFPEEEKQTLKIQPERLAQPRAYANDREYREIRLTGAGDGDVGRTENHAGQGDSNFR